MKDDRGAKSMRPNTPGDAVGRGNRASHEKDEWNKIGQFQRFLSPVVAPPLVVVVVNTAETRRMDGECLVSFCRTSPFGGEDASSRKPSGGEHWPTSICSHPRMLTNDVVDKD